MLLSVFIGVHRWFNRFLLSVLQPSVAQKNGAMRPAQHGGSPL